MTTKKSKTPAIDLAEFLQPDYVAPKPRVQHKRREVPHEVVYYWTYYKCKCGHEYSAPTHGEKPFVVYEVLKWKGNKYVPNGSVNYPLPCKGAAPTLPRRIVATSIHLEVCQSCLAETINPELWKIVPDLPVLIQPEADQLLFEHTLEATDSNLSILADAISDKGSIDMFHDKETN